MNMQGKKVLGVGAALVDLLIEIDDAWIAAQGEPKGGMTLVDWPRMDALLQQARDPSVVPGGSAANTIRGLGRLGGSAAFLSKVQNDALGNLFSENLLQAGVDSWLGHSAEPTGRVLSAVTPDAERTMYSYMGASSAMTPADINATMLQGLGMVYLEGYIAFNAPWFRAVVQAAKDAGVPVGLDLGSVSVVDFCRADIQWALDLGGVGLLVANEAEAQAWTGVKGTESLSSLAQAGAAITVLKLGKAGAQIQVGAEVFAVNAVTVRAVDTTGAGDLWATGFLYGLQQGFTMPQCGALAAAVAAEVVQVLGAEIPAAGWQRIAAVIAGFAHG